MKWLESRLKIFRNEPDIPAEIDSGNSSDGLMTSWLVRSFITLLAGLVTLRYSAGLVAWNEANKLEQPVYSVIRRLSNGVELRRYESYLIAETEVEGTGFRESTGDGFRTCARYIFGNNKARKKRGVEDESFDKMAMTAPVRVSGAAMDEDNEKMAMTSPVRTTSNAQKTRVSFVIGSEYSLRSAPIPLDRSVKLRRVPSHVLAARSFAGPPPKDERVAKERAKLDVALQEANVKVLRGRGNDETLVYGYHDPFATPNFLRRNEVAVMVDPRTVPQS